MSSYTFSDQKLAMISALLTMGSKEDIDVMVFALLLIKKRRDESARQQLLRLQREAS